MLECKIDIIVEINANINRLFKAILNLPHQKMSLTHNLLVPSMIANMPLTSTKPLTPLPYPPPNINIAPPTPQISICIPRTFANITWQQVKNAFEQALDSEGCVDRIDMIKINIQSGHDPKPHQRVFVHFKFWPLNPAATNIMNRLSENNGTGSFQLVYDHPWYWKCSLSRTPRPTAEDRRAARQARLNSLNTVNVLDSPTKSDSPARDSPARDPFAESLVGSSVMEAISNMD